MTTPSSPLPDTERLACPYCWKPIDQPVTHTIRDIGWNNVLRRQYARTREMQFCSDACGSNYQMGCEG